MPSTTSTTDPVPYYEVLSTFWAAACTARGTDLRGQMLINLEVLSPVPDGFVAELGSKLRPAGVEDGLRQAGSGESAGIDVADADAPILPHEPRGQLVQEMPATVRNLGVDGPHPQLAPSTLRDGELSLVSAVNAWRLDLFTRGKGGQRLEAEVDADLASPMRLVFEDRYLQIEVPAAASVLLDLATVVPNVVYRPRLPLEIPTGGRILDPVAVAQHHVNIVVDRCCTNKTDAKHAAVIFTLDQSSAVAGLATIHLVTRLGADPTYAPTRRSRTHRSLRLSTAVRAHHRAPPPRPERRGFWRGEFR